MMLFPLLLCLLLCGCSAEAPAETTVPNSAIVETITAKQMQLAADILEQKYSSSIEAIPLTQRKVQGIRAMDDGLLVFSGYGSTTLTLLTGEDLSADASVTLEFELNPNDPSVQIGSNALSYFDPVTQDTVVLNGSLEEVKRVAVGDDLVGSPILSSDQNTLYYCTSNAIQAWNLETDIRRCVKELSYDEQTLIGIHKEDTVLQCRILDGNVVRTLFLSAETGQLLRELEGDVTLLTEEERYYASFAIGSVPALVFGEGSSKPQELQPKEVPTACVFLPGMHGAVTVTDALDENIHLDYYALDSGTRQAALTLDSLHTPASIVEGNGSCVYLLIYDPEYDCEMLCRWKIPATDAALPAAEAMCYTGTYYTAESPDRAALAQCQTYAAEIGRKYGIEVLIWEDAAKKRPWDYVFETEYLPRVILEELTRLEQRLSVYPEGFLAETASRFSGLTICLVRQITGSPESGSLNTATGIQFFDDSGAYVAIAAGEFAEQALYHELFHVIETPILSNSTAFDQWEKLNPTGFTYDYNYLTNASRNSGIYLKGSSRAFVDTYSMSYPKEDRARIMEYAILPGNKELFRSETMQAKLKTLCQGIREAYGLEMSEEEFIWEQYLEHSLAYHK